MLAERQRAGRDGRGVDVESEEVPAHGRRTAGEPWTNGDFEAELFLDLSGQGGGRGFAGLDFAAWEFPFAGEAHLGAMLRHEALVSLPDGGADDVEGRHGASVTSVAGRGVL